MSKKIFKALIILLITISISKAEILKPSSDINPKEVIKTLIENYEVRGVYFL